MNTIEQVLSGRLDIATFEQMLKDDARLQNEVRSIIPKEAIGNKKHPFWKTTPYASVGSCQFDYYKFLSWAQEGHNQIGRNLNIFSRLERAYRYYNPTFRCSNRYYEECKLFLRITRDCYGGPEVEMLVTGIIQTALKISGKGKQENFAKEEIKKAFHLEGSKCPRWIQGADWPMGVKSPMIFLEQKKDIQDPETVNYFFKDADTNEQRVVTQYY